MRSIIWVAREQAKIGAHSVSVLGCIWGRNDMAHGV
jgi:hypothetical protein